jgi:acyl carrier protein|tara:strand:+ start:100 stop:345 length:246 start_codon:yes stop_codon:yes gene_type:complete
MQLNEEKLKTAFVEALSLTDAQYREDLKLGDVKKWDSLGHFNLIFAVERAFGVRFESDEIPELQSLAAIKECLQKKEGVAV